MSYSDLDFMDDLKDKSNSLKNYYRRKFRLQRKIIRSQSFFRHPVDFEPYCMLCKNRFSSVEELHIHHLDKDGEAKRSNGDAPGGTQCLKRYERHFNEGKNLVVVCAECHYLLHKKDGDSDAGKLLAGRQWLEYLTDKDPEFEIRQRIKDAEVYFE